MKHRNMNSDDNSDPSGDNGYEEKNNKLAPKGSHVGICIQVIDMGNHEVPKFKKEGNSFVVDGHKWQHKMRLLFELTQKKHVFYESKGEQPFVVGREYTFSFYPGKADLAKLVSNWTAIEVDKDIQKAFEDGDRDLNEFLGVAGMVTVIHDKTKVWYKHKDNGSTVNQKKVDEDPTAYNLSEYEQMGGREYATIGTVTPIPEVLTPEQIGKAESPLINFDFDGDITIMRETYKSLPKFMREKIAKASEFKDFFGGITPGNDQHEAEVVDTSKNPSATDEDVPDDLPF